MNRSNCGNRCSGARDFGPEPLVLNIECATEKNTNFRTALWTGHHLQVTLMCIPVGCDIGLEVHEDVDQFIRIQSGNALVKMGRCPNSMCEQQCVNGDFAVIVPAGTWHNVINTGNCPLKLYSIYAPPNHPCGTVQRTKEDAEADERRGY